ncbi:MAG TPA: glycine zipper 2TM domain-containing protein, partial [Gemmatimonadales bacterium]|nr:glycine zipper 2TM domain-containing protein [Gemmatimonadales bacterium]
MNVSIFRLAALLSSAAMVAACAKGDQANQAATDSTTTAAAVPATPISGNDKPLPTNAKPASKPAPARPAGPSSYTAAAGAFLDVAVNDTISTKTAKVGDVFTGTVVANVSDGHGATVIPQGAQVHGTVTEVQTSQLTLAVSSVTIRGKDYGLAAKIDSLETVKQSKGVGGNDVAKVGIGAAAGALLGRVIGGNTKGAVIGGVVGAAAGTGVAAKTHA